MGRPPNYSGILSKSKVSKLPVEGKWKPNDAPPDWFRQQAQIFDIPEERLTYAWKTMCQEVCKFNRDAAREDVEQFFQCLAALAQHYGISLQDHSWVNDLADSLREKHERGMTWSQIGEKFGLPRGANEIKRVLCLACRHVPGFKITYPVPKKHRLNVVDTMALLSAIVPISMHLQEDGAIASTRAIAKVMLDEKKLRRVLSPTSARRLTEIINTRGNAERSKITPLAERTLRNYIDDMRGDAWSAYKQGTANSFQRQFIEDVLPAIRFITRGE